MDSKLKIAVEAMDLASSELVEIFQQYEGDLADAAQGIAESLQEALAAIGPIEPDCVSKLPDAGQDERAAFEEKFQLTSVTRSSWNSERYGNPMVQFAWEGWEARAALTAKPAEGEAAKDIAKRIHYPEHWDTAAYPTLVEALWECVPDFKCSECDAAAPEPHPAPESVDMALDQFIAAYQYHRSEKDGEVIALRNIGKSYIDAWHNASVAEALAVQMAVIKVAGELDQAEFNRKWTEQRDRAEKAEATVTGLRLEVNAQKERANNAESTSSLWASRYADAVVAAQPAPQAGQVPLKPTNHMMNMGAEEWMSGQHQKYSVQEKVSRIYARMLDAAPPATAWTIDQINHAASVSGIGASDKARWFASMIMAGPDSMVQPDYEASAKLNVSHHPV